VPVARSRHRFPLTSPSALSKLGRSGSVAGRILMSLYFAPMVLYWVVRVDMVVVCMSRSQCVLAPTDVGNCFMQTNQPTPMFKYCVVGVGVEEHSRLRTYKGQLRYPTCEEVETVGIG
jgi:hypothetical protein